MSNTVTSSSVGQGIRSGASSAVQVQLAVGDASTNVNNVTLYAKFAKKAEDTAQAAI